MQKSRKIFIPAGLIYIIGLVIIYYFILNKYDVFKEWGGIEIYDGPFAYENSPPDSTDVFTVSKHIVKSFYVSYSENVSSFHWHMLQPYVKELEKKKDITYSVAISFEKSIKYAVFISFLDTLEMNFNKNDNIVWLFHKGTIYIFYFAQGKNLFEKIRNFSSVRTSIDLRLFETENEQGYLENLLSSINETAPASYVLLVSVIILGLLNFHLFSKLCEERKLPWKNIFKTKILHLKWLCLTFLLYILFYFLPLTFVPGGFFSDRDPTKASDIFSGTWVFGGLFTIAASIGFILKRVPTKEIVSASICVFFLWFVVTLSRNYSITEAIVDNILSISALLILIGMFSFFAVWWGKCIKKITAKELNE